MEIRLQWGTAIASHADIGQQVLSKLSRSEVRMHSRSLRGLKTLAPTTRLSRVHTSGANPVGANLLTEHPEAGVTDVYAAILSGLPFQPGAHVQSQETVLRV